MKFQERQTFAWIVLVVLAIAVPAVIALGSFIVLALLSLVGVAHTHGLILGWLSVKEHIYDVYSRKWYWGYTPKTMIIARYYGYLLFGMIAYQFCELVAYSFRQFERALIAPRRRRAQVVTTNDRA